MSTDEKAREIAAAIVRDYFETVHADDFEPLADIIATALLAARREGIEEAAKECKRLKEIWDDPPPTFAPLYDYVCAAEEIEAAIRALNEKAPTSGRDAGA